MSGAEGVHQDGRAPGSTCQQGSPGAHRPSAHDHEIRSPFRGPAHRVRVRAEAGSPLIESPLIGSLLIESPLIDPPLIELTAAPRQAGGTGPMPRASAAARLGPPKVRSARP